MQRDGQRSKVYKFDDTFPRKHLSLEQCRELADKIADRYRRRRVQVKDGRRRRIACYSPWENAIELPLWARTDIEVCHEMAHAVAPDSSLHDKVFMRVFIDILAEFTGLKKADLRKRAKECRCRVASSRAAPQMLGVRAIKEIARIKAQIAYHRRELDRLQRDLDELR